MVKVANHAARPTGALRHSARADRLFDAEARRFVPWQWVWERGDGPVPQDAREVCPSEALALVAREGSARPLPVGIIGPRECSAAQAATASALGARLARARLTLICGGRSGVMAAAAKGCREAGGLSVGLLPDTDWRAADAAVTLPIATGLGEARNAVIARASVALLAVGDSHGTLSEVALGLHFGRCVIGLDGPPRVAGVRAAEDVERAMDLLAADLLGA